jgi:integrase
MYGSGLLLMECLRLRVKDLDFDQGTITIHDGKGGKHRVVPLPVALEDRPRRGSPKSPRRNSLAKASRDPHDSVRPTSPNEDRDSACAHS